MVSPEGKLAGQHLKQHHAEGKNIASLINVLPLDLFGSHVGESSHGAGSPGELQGAFQLCQSEVHHLDLLLRIHHDIVGLDIAMDDPL